MAYDTDLPNLLSPLSPNEFLDSQQRRAINLVRALMQDGDGLHGKSMAIVGAGFAGLTAAAFALEKTTAQVTLFEAAPRPLWLQDNCNSRWLHPGIYDWPLPGSLEPRTALPVLNWRAGAASEVAAQVRAEWDRIAATKGLLRLYLETRIAGVTADGNGKLVLRLADGGEEVFDVVVLAVGFGLESGGQGRIGYWNDADGLDGVALGASVLVSGFGDGGLADVLRLCLPEIRQDSLIELVRHIPYQYGQKLVDWEERYRGDAAALDKCYRELRVDPIIKALANAAPALARVTLAGNGHLYGPRSAILNRFLVSQLSKARGDAAFELVNKPVIEESLTELADGRQRIRFSAEEDAREFDHVVLRLGPQPAYRSVAPLHDWEVGEERRRHWYEMPQSMDRTRVPLGEERGALVSTENLNQVFLAYESSSRRWCLVLRPPDTTFNWAVHARLALDKVAASISGLNIHPLVIDCAEAVASQTAIYNAVRALCAADIVIVDATGYDPSLLLLLGIRAAVRRSITIACTRDPLSPALWDKMPFNLKELNLVSFHDEETGHLELVAALRAGLTQSSMSPHYLDLPVYDYVREDSTDAAVNLSNVLLLRAFSQYDGARKLHVEQGIHAALGLSADARVEAVIDQTSPRLAGQRLYEAIRHWQTCVVDLTWWRANVLFELGVRLAVCPGRTFCLIDEKPEGDLTFTGTRSSLLSLLRPFAYDLDTETFAAAFAAPVTTQIYETAALHFRAEQDYVSGDVDVMLVATAAVTSSHDDPLQTVDVTPLYARHNLDYGAALRYSAFERLCAAWCYLADRTEPHAGRPIDLLDPRYAATFRRFRRLGSRLRSALAHRYEPRDTRLRRRIEECEAVARAAGTTAMADLLDAWLALRRDPPWKIDVSKVNANEWTDLINDYQDQLDQIKALENRLVELASPVCVLPLQGVQSDLRRVEIMLQQFRRRRP
jgi:hypothetical protein